MSLLGIELLNQIRVFIISLHKGSGFLTLNGMTGTPTGTVVNGLQIHLVSSTEIEWVLLHLVDNIKLNFLTAAQS
jgi:hypothetical protein